MVDRNYHLFLARVCEQSERYEDMLEHVGSLVSMGTDLTLEERNLFSIAYKHVVGSRRTAWRAIQGIAQREIGDDKEEFREIIATYRKSIEKELRDYCTQVLKHIEDDLMPIAADNESKVFWLKMRGDYCRYLAESLDDNDAHHKAAEDAHEAYKQASSLALNHLPAIHPIRLGLALNYSVFYYEILNSAERACLLAKAAFDDAIPKMENLDDDNYKDSATIMQLLRDNLTLWTSDVHPVNEDQLNVEDLEG
mmetsp:Transcript_22226/g.56074  ORF Transcript_22226/g.56074 Transcript_22226/m.56074 type:complete len:252 (+) Transcript_22226:267-1022(+)|eukprot:CAMPEP_0178999402 /NCGR_PEP_ID=MMETSP0795-20121207/10041_1 /TAXON_ID=88552 /ORGANISM="Amoebophrya sp., Strain Ameob2" /LENGTH=251 /DNA_ID=CAMNT_0020692173 /DNA_START=244 /DNA_END=999 /DNA_ORIENTATION=-